MVPNMIDVIVYKFYISKYKDNISKLRISKKINLFPIKDMSQLLSMEIIELSTIKIASFPPENASFYQL
jgi:hypothetical protein